MISLTINRYNHHGLINNHLPVLIINNHLNQFVFHCFLLLSLTFTVQSELNSTTTIIKSLSTTPISLIDSDDLTTSYNFLNPVTLVDNLTSITETLTVDLSTNPINVTNNNNNYSNNLNSSTINHADYNETTSSIATTIYPNHVTLFLDGDDEVNTLPSTTINFDGTNNLTDSDSINSNEIINLSPSTINPANFTFKSPTLPNTITDNNETTTTPTINFNQSSTLIDSEVTTILTIDMINNDTINSKIISSMKNNETTLSSSSTNLVIDTSNQTICDSPKNQIVNHPNQRLAIDHYEAKKFFLFTVILLGLCCLLVLIVLVLVVYIFRKLTRERTIKIPQVNNNNHITGGGGRGGGSIEFDTIKDGRFYQWQGNVNSGFESSDLNESTTQSTGYRFLEGSVVPYTERYHNDLKSSSTETFGNHHHNQPNHLNQSSLSSINSLPKTATITTVDTRL